MDLFLRRFVRCCLAALTALGMTACTAALDESRLLESRLETKSAPQTKQQKLNDYLASAQREDSERTPAGLVKYGNDQFFGDGSQDQVNLDQDSAGDVQLHLVDVPVAAAAKSVLGDVLELNYSVDARVQGNITLETSKPTSGASVLKMFEGALRDIGAAIIGDGNSFRIVPLADAARSVAPVQTVEAESGQSMQLGQQPRIIPLRYVSADEIREVIEPLIPAGMLVRTDNNRNAIIINGTASEIAAIQETIAVFDVDWMRGMSFALVSVKSSQPSAIVSDLEQVYDTKRGPLRNVVRFVPNRRLKSVLIITSRAKYIKEATSWIKKLDALAATEEQSLHVYRVQNRTAARTCPDSAVRASQQRCT